MDAAMKAIESDMRVPDQTTSQRSLPVSSVPNQCSDEGFWYQVPGLLMFGVTAGS